MNPTLVQPDATAGRTHPRETLIVGIGASAGGLEAVKGLLTSIGDVEGIAFVVIMHLDPERESGLAEVLQRGTSLPVSQLNESRMIESGHVYVIPPDRSLSVIDGRLALQPFEQPRGHRAPIDLFFRSLASTPGGGVAIVLSGGGSDGAVGLKAVKEAGGLVMAQEPGEAMHGSMPRNAIATGLVDFVLPVTDLASRVVEF